MNKNQLTMAVIGGTGAVIAAALFVLAWLGGSTIDELKSELADNKAACDENRALTRKAGNKHKENLAVLKEMSQKAYDTVTNGYALSEIPTADALQKLMHDSAERFKKLPADVARKIVKQDFGFGSFSDYIKGTVPSKKDVPLLYRRWCDVQRITEILLQSRATEMIGVKVLTKAVAAEEEKPRNWRSRSNDRKPAGEKIAKYPCQEESYEIEFIASPSALSSVINALAADKRFFVVDSLKFAQSTDALIQALGEGTGAEGGKGKSKREKKALLEKKAEEEANRGKKLVTDPATVEPFVVTMKITSMLFMAKEESK